MVNNVFMVWRPNVFATVFSCKEIFLARISFREQKCLTEKCKLSIFSSKYLLIGQHWQKKLCRIILSWKSFTLDYFLFLSSYKNFKLLFLSARLILKKICKMLLSQKMSERHVGIFDIFVFFHFMFTVEFEERRKIKRFCRCAFWQVGYSWLTDLTR